MLRKREAALLDEGRGACFELLPASGHLRPWGQMAVAVSVHSNMWGKYEDVLVSDMEGLPPVQLPLALGVAGLPLRLHDATVNLTLILTLTPIPTPASTPTPTPAPTLTLTPAPTLTLTLTLTQVGLTSRGAESVLSWAPAAIGAAPVQKTIRVMNNGCAAAQLTWALVHLPDPERPLQATTEVDDYGKIKLAVGRPEYEPIEPEDVRFSVSPAVDRDARGLTLTLTLTNPNPNPNLNPNPNPNPSPDPNPDPNPNQGARSPSPSTRARTAPSPSPLTRARRAYPNFNPGPNPGPNPPSP